MRTMRIRSYINGEGKKVELLYLFYLGHGAAVVDAAEQAGERCPDDEGGQGDDDRDLSRYANHHHVRRVQARSLLRQSGRRLVVVVLVHIVVHLSVFLLLPTVIFRTWNKEA